MSEAANPQDATRKDAALSITMPADLAGCQTLIEQLTRAVHSRTSTIEQLNREKETLELALAEAIQRLFHQRSERYLDDPNQLRLDLGGTDDAADAAEDLAQAVQEAGLPVQAHTRRRHVPKPRSEALPGHLPRYEVEAPAPEAVKHCPEHGERVLIGYDTVETLEFERPPASRPRHQVSHSSPSSCRISGKPLGRLRPRSSTSESRIGAASGGRHAADTRPPCRK